jgi:hypothetical protein
MEGNLLMKESPRIQRFPVGVGDWNSDTHVGGATGLVNCIGTPKAYV